MSDPRTTTRQLSARAEADMAAELPGWRAYAWEVVRHGVIVTGAARRGAPCPRVKAALGTHRCGTCGQHQARR